MCRATKIADLWIVNSHVIFRRTQEQIKVLEDSSPPDLIDMLRKEEEQNGYIDNPYRSLNPEYLVIELRGNEKEIYLKEIVISYPCNDFQYFSEIKKVRNQREIYGGFYCALSYGYRTDDLTEIWMVYDLAGRAPEPWVSPLTVPEHFFRKNGKLVLGPTP